MKGNIPEIIFPAAGNCHPSVNKKGRRQAPAFTGISQRLILMLFFQSAHSLTPCSRHRGTDIPKLRMLRKRQPCINVTRNLNLITDENNPANGL